MSIAACLRGSLRLSVASCSLLQRSYHAVARAVTISAEPPRLLGVAGPAFAPPSCGFKVKGRLKRRCKDCYFKVSQRRLYVLCPTHPRHKQMSMKAPDKYSWMLSHATQGKERPW